MPLIDFTSWANTNPVDGISGQPAIIEPGTSKKDSGFLRIERPPRQDLNWLFNNRDELIKLIRNSNKNMIAGFELNQFVDEGAGTSWSLEVKQGRCMSSDSLMFFDTGVDTGWPGSVLKKFITGGTFVAGDGQPGLSAGATALSSTLTGWYHVFVIRLSSGDIDVGFDDNTNATNLIAIEGVTHWRRIFSFRWRGNDSVSPVDRPLFMAQKGDHFLVSDSVLVDNGFTIGAGLTSGEDVVVNTPIGIETVIRLVVVAVDNSSGVSFIQFFGDNQEIVTPNIQSSDLELGVSTRTQIEIPSSGLLTERKIKAEFDTAVSGGGSVSIGFYIKSWIDRRGKDII